MIIQYKEITERIATSDEIIDSINAWIDCYQRHIKQIRQWLTDKDMKVTTSKIELLMYEFELNEWKTIRELFLLKNISSTKEYAMQQIKKIDYEEDLMWIKYSKKIKYPWVGDLTRNDSKLCGIRIRRKNALETVISNTFNKRFELNSPEKLLKEGQDGNYFVLALWEELFEDESGSQINALLENKDNTFSCYCLCGSNSWAAGDYDSLRTGWKLDDNLRYKIFNKRHTIYCDCPEFTQSKLTKRILEKIKSI